MAYRSPLVIVFSDPYGTTLGTKTINHPVDADNRANFLTLNCGIARALHVVSAAAEETVDDLMAIEELESTR